MLTPYDVYTLQYQYDLLIAVRFPVPVQTDVRFKINVVQLTQFSERLFQLSTLTVSDGTALCVQCRTTFQVYEAGKWPLFNHLICTAPLR